MRLLEPLNGIKVGQGHYIIHLYFFISMLLIDKDETFKMKELKPSENELVQSMFREEYN